MKTRRLLIAAAVIIVACVLTGVLPPGRFNPQQALAQMARNVRSARTLVVSAAISAPGQPAVNMKMKVNNRGQMRQEMENAVAGSIVNIIDFNAGKMLSLVSSQKTGMQMNLGQLPPDQIPQNFVDEFSKLPQGDTKLVEEKRVDGKMILVYESTLPEMKAMQMKVEVDKATLLPVRSRMQMPNPAGEGQMLMELSDFQWDVPLDASLFAIAAPEGYQIRTMDMNLSKAGPEDVARLLKLCVAMNGDRFLDEFDPQKLPMTFMTLNTSFVKRMNEEGGGGLEALKTLARDGLGLDLAVNDQAEVTQFTVRMAEASSRGMVALMQIAKEQKPFHYLGKGVKKGQAGKIVCYWPDSNGADYHAIDAEFKVHLLKRSQLPKEPAGF